MLAGSHRNRGADREGARTLEILLRGDDLAGSGRHFNFCGEGHRLTHGRFRANAPLAARLFGGVEPPVLRHPRDKTVEPSFARGALRQAMPAPSLRQFRKGRASAQLPAKRIDIGDFPLAGEFRKGIDDRRIRSLFGYRAPPPKVARHAPTDAPAGGGKNEFVIIPGAAFGHVSIFDRRALPEEIETAVGKGEGAVAFENDLRHAEEMLMTRGRLVHLGEFALEGSEVRPAKHVAIVGFDIGRENLVEQVPTVGIERYPVEIYDLSNCMLAHPVLLSGGTTIVSDAPSICIREAARGSAP